MGTAGGARRVAEEEAGRLAGSPLGETQQAGGSEAAGRGKQEGRKKAGRQAVI